jgi:hypothetical protein
MKKILLFILIAGFSWSTFAQMATVKHQAKFETTIAVAQNAVDTPERTYEGFGNPYVSNERGQDIVIGETYYDLQSNSSIPYRFHVYDDGTMAGTWTMSHETASFPSCPDRGTGYNYYDGTDWGPYPENRVEEVRTGWPSYAPYGENGEIICSHTGNASGLQFSWRETKGEGDWTYFNLVGPAGHEDLLWPRMMTSGENHDVIHVIALTAPTGLGGSIYEGQDGALLYSRSDDGGQTWDPENVILEGTGSDYATGWGGDDYAWAQAKGDVLAFVLFGGVADGLIMKSTDGGDSWERITFYESPDPFFDGNGGNLPRCGGGDGYNGIAIDDGGIVHVVFGRQIHLDDTPDDNSWSYYPYSDGLIYWNETMEPLDTAQIRNDIIPEDWSTLPIYQNGQLAAWTQPNGDDTIVGVPYYGASLTSMPQIIVENGIVQVFYSALTIGFATEEYNYRHIWGVFSEGDGQWSEQTDYTNDVFHLLSECVYPSLAQSTYGDSYHILYETDNMPGNALQPTPPTHDPVLNKMVYLPVAPLPVGISENQETASFEVSQNYPNPVVSETNLMVTLNQSADINLDVYTLTGQLVSSTNYGHQAAGTHVLTINASNLASGVYFYTVTSGNQKVTHKMIVQ